MNVLCGTSSVGFAPTDPIASTYNQNVIATVVYGDESRAAGQTYDEGTCETFGVSISPLITYTPQREKDEPY